MLLEFLSSPPKNSLGCQELEFLAKCPLVHLLWRKCPSDMNQAKRVPSHPGCFQETRSFLITSNRETHLSPTYWKRVPLFPLQNHHIFSPCFNRKSGAPESQADAGVPDRPAHILKIKRSWEVRVLRRMGKAHMQAGVLGHGCELYDYSSKCTCFPSTLYPNQSLIKESTNILKMWQDRSICLQYIKQIHAPLLATVPGTACSQRTIVSIKFLSHGRQSLGTAIWHYVTYCCSSVPWPCWWLFSHVMLQA